MLGYSAMCDLSLITISVSHCCLFSDINISQGSVAMHLRCGGIFSHQFTANLSPSLTVKELWKPVKIWQSYCDEFRGLLFCNTMYMVQMWANLTGEVVLLCRRVTRWREPRQRTDVEVSINLRVRQWIDTRQQTRGSVLPTQTNRSTDRQTQHAAQSATTDRIYIVLRYGLIIK